MKNPPILIAVLGFFAALAGFGFLAFGFRVLGFDWFGALGDVPAFESVGLWGWLAIATGVVWLAAATGLWTLRPWARWFAMFVVGFALVEAALAFFHFPGTGVAFAMGLLPLVLLWYLNTRDVKAAFGEGEPVADETEATAPAPAAPPAPAVPPASAAAAAVTAAAVASEPAPVEPTGAVAASAIPEPVAAPVVAAAAPAPAAAHTMRIAEVEGIGEVYATKLSAAGVVTTDDLLRVGASPNGRLKLADEAGISGHLILEWVNNADLMRVPGVGPQYSDLLEAAGVDSPAELAQRDPAHLAVTVQEVVAARPGIVRRMPTEAEIEGWIAAARAMDKVVEH